MAWYQRDRQTRRQHGLLARALAAAPGPGDQIDMAVVFPKRGDRKLAALEMDYFKEFSFAQEKGRYVAVRRGLSEDTRPADGGEGKKLRGGSGLENGDASGTGDCGAKKNQPSDGKKPRRVGRVVEGQNRPGEAARLSTYGLGLVRVALKLRQINHPRVLGVDQALVREESELAAIAQERGIPLGVLRKDLTAARRALAKKIKGDPGEWDLIVERG